MASGERSFYEIQKSVVAALGKKLHLVGFRVIELLNVPGLHGEKVHAILDLNLHQSPIFGIGEDDEHAAADAIRRNGTPYAYVLGFFDSYRKNSRDKVKDLLWNLRDDDVVDLPTEDSVAVSTKVNRYELKNLLEKLPIKNVKLV